MAISGDGTRVIVGAPLNDNLVGSARVLELDPSMSTTTNTTAPAAAATRALSLLLVVAVLLSAL